MNPGDRVVLKSCPYATPMTVKEVQPNGTVLCSWADNVAAFDIAHLTTREDIYQATHTTFIQKESK